LGRGLFDFRLKLHFHALEQESAGKARLAHHDIGRYPCSLEYVM